MSKHRQFSQDIIASTAAPPESSCTIIQNEMHRDIMSSHGYPLSKFQEISLQKRLLTQGFNRTGPAFFTPDCPECSLCYASRIPLEQFQPNRSQTRCMKKNLDLQLSKTTKLTGEHFQLAVTHARNQFDWQHKDQTDEEIYKNLENFTLAPSTPHTQTTYIECRDPDDDALLAFIQIDIYDDSISCNRFFYDPTENKRELGKYATLLSLLYGQQHEKKYAYLGPWNPQTTSLDYKQNFSPLEILTECGWQTIPKETINIRPPKPT